MTDVAKHALEMLHISQKCMKVALAVYDGRPDRAEEIISLRDKLAAVDYLIELVNKDG